MFATQKRRSFILLFLVLAIACVLVLAVRTAMKAYATEKTVHTISSFLAEKGIEYSYVNVNNGTLSVKLASTGDERCTLDDVKAIQAIYEAVHAQTINGQVINVGIEIYNTSGELIYDVFENDVSVPVDDVEKLVTLNSDQKTDMTMNDIMLKVENIVKEFPYSVQQSKIATATQIPGEKLQLTLIENNNDISSIADIRVIYENLESFALSTNEITQCEITVNNIDGNCVLYMAGDFLYGNCVAWLSPKAESFFLAQEGPR